MLLELYKKHSPKYCIICASIESSFCALSRLSPANFALMLGTLHVSHQSFVIILLLSIGTLMVVHKRSYAVQNVQKSKPRTIREKRAYFTKIAALPLAWYRNLPYPYGRDVTSTGPL